jgi:hypothetical protein
VLIGWDTVVWRSTFQYAPSLETGSEEELSEEDLSVSRGVGSGVGVRHDGSSTANAERVHSEYRAIPDRVQREFSRSEYRTGPV